MSRPQQIPEHYVQCSAETEVQALSKYAYKLSKNLKNIKFLSCDLENEVRPILYNANFGIDIGNIVEFEYDHNRMFVLLYRHDKPLVTPCDGSTVRHYELFMYAESAKIIESFTKDAIIDDEHVERDHINIFSVFAHHEHAYCVKIGARKKRSLDTIYVDENVKNELVTDIQTFLKSEDIYHQNGIPFKRNYLLEGNPGTGKTSMICAIASMLDYNVVIMRLEAKEIKLEHVLHQIPDKSILLLEDIQHTFPQDGNNNSDTKIDEMLSILDGIYCKYGLITIMTLNPGLGVKFPPNLLRSGRVDKKVVIANPSEKEIKKIFKMFCPSEDVNAFYNSVKHFAKDLTPAMLQNFLFGKDGQQKNVNELKELVNSSKHEQKESIKRNKKRSRDMAKLDLNCF